MHLLLEDVLEDIRTEIPDNYSLIIEKWAGDAFPPTLNVPIFSGTNQALIWLSVTLIERGHVVVFRSRKGNSRLLEDVREMTYEVLSSRRKL